MVAESSFWGASLCPAWLLACKIPPGTSAGWQSPTMNMHALRMPPH